MSPDRLPTEEEHAVKCPICGAAAGEACRYLPPMLGARIRSQPHLTRVRLAVSESLDAPMKRLNDLQARERAVTVIADFLEKQSSLPKAGERAAARSVLSELEGAGLKLAMREDVPALVARTRELENENKNLRNELGIAAQQLYGAGLTFQGGRANAALAASSTPQPEDAP